MKYYRFFTLVGIFLTVSPTLPTLNAQTSKRSLEAYSNYVVIGAFAIHKNAIRFTNHAVSDLHLSAKYEMNFNRNLYYVYVLGTNDRDEAITEARKLREESEFKDTWVYSGWFSKKEFGAGEVAGVDINPMTEKTIERVAPTEGYSVEVGEDADAPAGDGTSNDAEASSLVATAAKPADTYEDPNPEISGKRFYFKIYRAFKTETDTVRGDVDVIDVERARKIGTYKGNRTVKVTYPSSKSGKVSLVCEVFGYRKAQRDVDYANPSGDGIEENENVTVVPFELMRLQKGDIAVMYNVYFYKDAGVMRPESRFEINSLVEMLQENEKYKIKIHGHTNGNAPGKIISLPENSKNYFSLTGTKEGFGSAKKLAEERGNVIKTYLVDNGIDPKRMQVKAWGGKHPIHHKHHTRAQENVRVEIEILDN